MQGLLDLAATVETPGGTHDLGGEGFPENSLGREFGNDRGEGIGAFFLFARADEIADSE